MSKWQEIAPQLIYWGYPDCDVLLIDPPSADESICDFAIRAEDSGDTLFLFLCREANEDIDADTYLARLDRAIRDIQSIKVSVQEHKQLQKDIP